MSTGQKLLIHFGLFCLKIRRAVVVFPYYEYNLFWYIIIVVNYVNYTNQ